MYVCACMRMRMRVCVYACTRVRMRVRVYACTRVCVRVPDSNSRTNGGQIAAEAGMLELLKTMALSGSPEEKTRATSVCYHISRSPQVCAGVGRGQGAG